MIRFLDANRERWHDSVQVIADYFSAAELLDCQAPQCSLAPGSGSVTLWTTTNFTIQLACNAPSGVCP